MDPFADPVVLFVATVVPAGLGAIVMALAAAADAAVPGSHPDRAWWIGLAIVGVGVAAFGRWIGAW